MLFVCLLVATIPKAYVRRHFIVEESAEENRELDDIRAGLVRYIATSKSKSAELTTSTEVVKKNIRRRLSFFLPSSLCEIHKGCLNWKGDSLQFFAAIGWLTSKKKILLQKESMLVTKAKIPEDLEKLPDPFASDQYRLDMAQEIEETSEAKAALEQLRSKKSASVFSF